MRCIARASEEDGNGATSRRSVCISSASRDHQAAAAAHAANVSENVCHVPSSLARTLGANRESCSRRLPNSALTSQPRMLKWCARCSDRCVTAVLLCSPLLLAAGPARAKDLKKAEQE